MLKRSVRWFQLHLSSRQTSSPRKTKSNERMFLCYGHFLLRRFQAFPLRASCRGSEKRFLSAQTLQNFFMTSKLSCYSSTARGLQKIRLFSANNRKQLTTAEPELWRRLFVMKWKKILPRLFSSRARATPEKNNTKTFSNSLQRWLLYFPINWARGFRLEERERKTNEATKQNELSHRAREGVELLRELNQNMDRWENTLPETLHVENSLSVARIRLTRKSSYSQSM